jgi:hypothetical protein
MQAIKFRRNGRCQRLRPWSAVRYPCRKWRSDREQAGAALHDALTALGRRTGTPEGLQASEIISAWSRNLPKQY